MPKQLPPLRLTSEERDYLQHYVRVGQRSARGIKRAHMLLQSDAGLAVSTISEQVGVSPATVYAIRHRYAAEGVEAALAEKPRSGQPRRLKLAQEAQLTVLACSAAPEGHARWTIRLLADKAVELGIVEHIAPETVRQFLKKTNLNLGASNAGASTSPTEPF
jgi:transposase